MPEAISQRIARQRIIELTQFHSHFFANLLEKASDRAVQILGAQACVVGLLERTISDFELSPRLDKQLTATALRLAKDLPSPSDIRQRLFARFRGPAPAVAIDSQRREIEREVKLKGIPMELSSDYVQTLERRIAVSADELPTFLRNYASIYDGIWSDPRIGARSPTRRIMLGMATVLRARSAQLSGATPQSSAIV